MKNTVTVFLFLLLFALLTFAQEAKQETTAKVNTTNNVENTTATTYDFTTGSDKYYGTTNAAVELGVGTGVWGMIAGDANGDGFIDGSDFLEPDNNKFQSGYLNSDTSMDGFVDGSDFVPVDNNKFKGTAVPNN